MQPKIIDYMLVEASREQLPALVLEHMNLGWQPLGGVSLNHSDYVYIQAMVKYDRVESNE